MANWILQVPLVINGVVYPEDSEFDPESELLPPMTLTDIHAVEDLEGLGEYDPEVEGGAHKFKEATP